MDSHAVAELMAEANVPGLALAVVRGGQLAETLELGRKRAGEDERVDRTTVFQAASLSKPVFAYLVLQLVSEGVLELDVPLSTYWVESYVHNDDMLSMVTARHVLSHTTGWPNWRPQGEPLVREAPP